MAARFADHLLDGDHAGRPSATAVAVGTLYACSDHGLIYQSDGAAWATWATLGGSVGALDDLSDVDTTGQATGEVLTFDGTVWAPAPPSGGGGGSAGYPLDTFTPDPTYHWAFSDPDVPAGVSRLGYVDADDVGDGSRLVVTGKGAGNYHYVAPPAGDWVATAKVWGNHTGAAGTMFGLLGVDDAGTGFGVTGYTGPEAVLLGKLSSNAYASSYTQFANPFVSELSAKNTRPTWYRLVKIGTNYSGAMSWDGQSWIPHTPKSSTAFTPTRVAIGAFIGSTGGGTYKIDWLDIKTL